MAITTVGDLLTYIRQELNSNANGDDTYALWKDAEIIDYIDQAQQEFARNTLCLPNYSDFTLTLSGTVREYSYDPKIIQVFGGYLNTLKRRVQVRSFKDLERSWLLGNEQLAVGGDWEEETGPPKFIIPDLEFGKLVLWPTPEAHDTLELYVYKEADHVSLTTDNLEIESQYRLGLTFKVMSLAYGKHDALETEDLQRSMLFGQKWQSFWQDAKKAYDLRFSR